MRTHKRIPSLLLGTSWGNHTRLFFKVISGWVPTCDSAYSCWLDSAASPEHQATSTMTCYPTQSHYHVTEPPSPYPILIMPSVWLGCNKYQFLCLWFNSNGFRTCGLWIWTWDLQIPPSLRTGALLIQPPWLVDHTWLVGESLMADISWRAHSL